MFRNMLMLPAVCIDIILEGRIHLNRSVHFNLIFGWFLLWSAVLFYVLLLSSHTAFKLLVQGRVKTLSFGILFCFLG